MPRRRFLWRRETALALARLDGAGVKLAMKWFCWFSLASLVFATGCATTANKTPQPLTQAEIIELAKAHTPDSEIVRRIKASDAAYRLSAVEVQHLHENGVSNAVIDFMLQEYVEAVRSQERERSVLYWYSWQPHWAGCRP